MDEIKKESEIKEKYLKEIYLNVLKAIIIILYFFVLNLAYENVARENLLIGIKVFTMIFLFASIYIFEKAYKKDDGKLAIQGLEVLVMAAYTLTTEHITNKFDFNFKSYSLVASYIFAIYFILRCIIIYTKGRKEVAEEFSDIREIVQKREPTKKEATKKVKKENDIVENIENNEELEDMKIETAQIENKEKKLPVKKKKKKVSDSTSINMEEKKTTTKKKTTTNSDIERKPTTNRKRPSQSQSKTISEGTTSKKTSSTKTNSTKTTTTKRTSVKKDDEKITERKKTTTATKTTATKTTARKKAPSDAVKKESPDRVQKIKKESSESLEERPKRKRVKKEVTEND